MSARIHHSEAEAEGVQGSANLSIKLKSPRVPKNPSVIKEEFWKTDLGKKGHIRVRDSGFTLGCRVGMAGTVLANNRFLTLRN